MPVVNAKEIHKAYGSRIVLRSADLTISTGEKVGVVGRNGAGKSTLARVLSGLEQPDTGTVSYRRGARVLYLEQVPRFPDDPSAEEAVLSGLGDWLEAVKRHEAASAKLSQGGGDSEIQLALQTQAAEDVERLGGWEQRHRVHTMLEKLGVRRPHVRVSTLSGGEQRRVALARILTAAPDLAILDEPTNHLDAATIEWLEQYLAEQYPGAVLLITHDRYLLDRVATRTIEVADGEVYAYAGGYELYLGQKAEREALLERTEQNRQNFLRRELEWLRRQPKARTTKQKARIERVEAAQAVSAPKLERAPSFELDVTRSGKTILELRQLRVELGGRVLIDGLDLFVTQGERIGVIGENGTGKTTLLRTILGEHTPSSGSVTLGQKTTLTYLDQQRSGLDEQASVFENIIADQPRIELGGQVIEPHTYVGRFGLDGLQQRQPVSSLSGGERARVALARMLRQSANLVVLDEPTNDLDVATLGALESMLVEFGITALVVTHDRWFLDRVATAIVAFEGDGKVLRYPGNYDTYRRLKAEAAKQHAAVSSGSVSGTNKSSRAAPKRKLTYAEERELANIWNLIEQAETKVAALDQELADPKTYSERGTEVPRLREQLELAKAEVERLSLRWEELETKKQG